MLFTTLLAGFVLLAKCTGGQNSSNHADSITLVETIRQRAMDAVSVHKSVNLERQVAASEEVEYPGAAERTARAEQMDEEEKKYREFMVKRMKAEDKALEKDRKRRMEDAEKFLRDKYWQWFDGDNWWKGKPDDAPPTNRHETSDESAVGTSIGWANIQRLVPHPSPNAAIPPTGSLSRKSSSQYRDPEPVWKPEGKIRTRTFQRYKDPESSHTNPFRDWNSKHRLHAHPRANHPEEHQKELGRSDLSDYDEVGVSENDSVKSDDIEIH